MKPRAHRRAFLRAVGSGLAALPFFRVVENAYAQSMGEPLPQRFIGVYHPHGIAAELFTRRPGDTETSFDISHPDCPLQPFDDAATYGESFKDKIIVIEGLDLLSSTNGHESAGTILTGSQITDELPQNSSLDQFLAVENRARRADAGDQRGARPWAAPTLESRETLSFGAGGIPISKIIDPVARVRPPVRERDRGQGSRGARAGRAPAQAGAQPDRLRAAATCGACAPGSRRLEQLKLDQHLEALRELEKKLEPCHAARRLRAAPPIPTRFPRWCAATAGSRTSTPSPIVTSTCSRSRWPATSRGSRRWSPAISRTRGTRSGFRRTTTAASRTPTRRPRSGTAGGPSPEPASPTPGDGSPSSTGTATARWLA